MNTPRTHPGTIEAIEAIGYARSVLSDARLSGGAEDVSTLAELVGRWDRLAAEDEPGLASWHEALSDVARQAREAAREVSVTSDWTTDPETGRSNSSQSFKDMCAEVSRLLGEGSGCALDRHWIAGRAALIVAQLAHVHHLAPRDAVVSPVGPTPDEPAA